MVLVTKRSWDLQRAYLGKEKKKENPPVNAGLVQNAKMFRSKTACEDTTGEISRTDVR